ncbi:MAG: hypothetical protein ACC628_06235 [Pirellulaceae bacterium]
MAVAVPMARLVVLHSDFFMIRIDAKALLWICTAAMLIAAAPGCSGCRPDPLVERKKELEEEKKKKEKRKEDFELKALVTIPGDDAFAFPYVKPGHWVTVRHEVTANNFDFQAELRTRSNDGKGHPYFVENTPFQLSSSRPTSLAKGQPKVVETTYFVPRVAVQQEASVWLHRELRSARGGRLIVQDPYKIATMPSYQYFFVVLARDPDRYGYLKRLTAVASPSAEMFDKDMLRYYRVVLPRVGRIVPLPSHSLTWSSVAYVMWDDIFPASFTMEQRQALLDWLHWGGQIIISGPNSLEKLLGEFLDAYLPAQALRTVEIERAQVDELNENWSLNDARTGQRLDLEVTPDKPLVGVELGLRDDAAFLPGCGQLACERRVGKGRIVVTAVSLSDRLLVNWKSFDSFFNACLLRRPPRRFEHREGMASAYWADYEPALVMDSRLSTTLRYFSRDVGHFTSQPPEEAARPSREKPRETQQRLASGMGWETELLEPVIADLSEEEQNPAGDSLHFNGYPPSQQFGVTAWNDSSGASDAARESLKDAAGISIPKGSFVLRVLAIYLMVLVPLNWGLFRLMGRVEWAWVAVPLIAIVGALAVVRWAQLDIGFARSTTEVAIVESYADYPRAHVTRYSALYTSLSTSYDLLFQNADAVAQPFSSATDYVRGPHDPTYSVTMRRDRDLSLRGFTVPSNKTGTVHCEQMCDLGGVFTLAGSDADGWHLVNKTMLNLQDAGVLHRTLNGQIQTAWIGELDPGGTTELGFANSAEPHVAQWNESSATLGNESQARDILARLDRNENGKLSRAEASADAELVDEFARLDRDGDGEWDHADLILWCRRSRAGEVSLGQLIELASKGLRLGRGEMRLVAWTDQELPGMTIRPDAAQVTRRTMVLVHLNASEMPKPRPDRNRRADVEPIQPESRETGPTPGDENNAEKKEDAAKAKSP